MPSTTSAEKTDTTLGHRSLRRLHDYGTVPENATREYIFERVKKQNVQFVNMQFTDLFGIVKAITIPVSKLEDAIDHNVWFDGSSIEGFTRIFESDMFLKPDLRTFAVLPWTVDSPAPTARIICDVYMSNGEPFSGDPRFILKQQLAKAAKLGYVYNTGPELEFFLFRKDEHGKIRPLPHDNGGYFDQTTDLAAEIRQEMSFDLQGMGIDVEALHHEVAEGSHEIDFRYADALTTADNAVTLRMVLKTVAMRHGLHATFMAKPIRGINGSGMHVHQSLFKNGANSFHEKSQEEYGLSRLAKSFIAGQLEHIRECNLVTNPTVNSYKRLVVGFEAPVYIAWARTNRSALIRVPQITAGRESATRIELRCPDPSCNPYLAFAVMLAAGLDGVERDLTPPAPVEENIFHFNDEEVRARSIGTVCGNLKEAIDACQGSELVRSVLGDHTFSKLISAKEAEWDDYRQSVTEWELAKYLEVY